MALSVCSRNFEADVLESAVPVLVYFWAPWCSLCHLCKPLLQKFESQWGGKIKVVSINADSNFDLANKYRITNLPTMILFHYGEISLHLDTFHGRDDLRATLEKITICCLPTTA